MAALPIIADTYRCALNWINTQSTDVATNVIHIQKSGTNAAAVWAQLDAAAAGGLWIPVSQTGFVDNVHVTPLDGSSVTFPVFTGRPTKWRGAGGTGDYFPAGAAVVKFLTATRGRSYRGRAYLPWVTETEQSNGSITPADVTSWTAAWVTWLTAMTTSGFVPVVASYKLATADPIIAVTGEPRLATQRRRQLR